jgi:Rrf2 family protein
MIRYGKMTQSAIAAMSRLAELYDGGARVSSLDIARTRNLPKPIVAKVLTVLSQGGLVTGAPGPTGGYRLARPPRQITLHDVARLFERGSESLSCPFGPGWCGTGTPCPLHDDLHELEERMMRFLNQTHFGVFRQAPDKRRG